MANSLALLLAAVFLGIGSVAYVVAAVTDSRLESPDARVQGAAGLGAIAAGLSGLRVAGMATDRPAFARAAPLALLVLLAGGVLVVFALRLLSSTAS